MKEKTLKINKPFNYKGVKFTEGQEITITVDKTDTPLDIFWRNRVKDSAIDGCVSFVEEKKSKKEI